MPTRLSDLHLQCEHSLTHNLLWGGLPLCSKKSIHSLYMAACTVSCCICVSVSLCEVPAEKHILEEQKIYFFMIYLSFSALK